MTFRFSSVNFFPELDNGQNDIWSSTAKNMRFNLASDRTIIVDARWESNLPGLAEEVLGDMNLYWVLLAYNGLVDPIEDVKPGVVLRIPRRKDLVAYLEREISYTEKTVQI